MGDRGQVRFIDDEGHSVWFYTHWGADRLIVDVAKALHEGKSRWGDPEYLARIIFCEMVGGDRGTTGFGIGHSEHGDVWQVVTVDARNRTVSVRSPEMTDVAFAMFIKEMMR